jgi:glucarate dehydratase
MLDNEAIVAPAVPQNIVPITAIRATPVNIPFTAPYHWSAGSHAGFTHTIIEVETRDGVLGLGEVPTHEAAVVISEVLGPKLLGANALDLADCERRCLPSAHTGSNLHDQNLLRAFGGVEIALWDITGQVSNRSIADLLGGRTRDAVAVTEYFAFRSPRDGEGGEQTPREVADYCARMAETFGSWAFECKVGVLDLTTEVEMVREVRAAIGDEALLRLDANMAWSVSTATEALRRLEVYNIRSVEEPVSSFLELTRLRSRTSIGFSSHTPDLKQAVALGVPDAFVVNLTALGGIRRTVGFISACEHLGFDVWFYSPDSGIANAAYLQVASAMSWMSQPNQSLLRWHSDDVLDEGPFVPRDGLLAVPDGPGLGIRLDRSALSRCHERFCNEGPYNTRLYTDRVLPSWRRRPEEVFTVD